MNTIIEILQYTLKAGSGTAFHKVMVTESAPLHTALGLTILRFGISLHHPDSYYLVRAFANIEVMENTLAAFYSDERWIQGPRSAIVQKIEHSHRVVMPYTVTVATELSHFQ